MLTHLWFSSYPFFETTLLISPAFRAVTQDAESKEGEASDPVHFQIYDADGALINEISLQFPRTRVGVLETEQLLGGCKLEAGLKHAHLVVDAPSGTRVMARIHSGQTAAILGEPGIVSPPRASFFPIKLSKDRSNFLCVVNRNHESANLRGRFFCGKRAPEMVWNVPGMGSRIVSIETEFLDSPEGEGERLLQGYLRLTTKSGSLGVQLLERSEGNSDMGIFSSVS